jgi:alkanesulfonate monooxygenase SsuD/methylene tetrahydromethanopterin reductase-like flavin-dependent oxidoreductase (luciferase family)
MKLGALFRPTGDHVAAWLHPDTQIDAGTNFRHYAEITQTAERGKFDLMFVADAVATRDGKLEAAQPLAAIHGLFRSADAAAGARCGDKANRSLRHCNDQL